MLKRFRKIVGLLNPFRAVSWLIFSARNRLRQRSKIDYIMFTLPSELPFLPESRGWLRERIQGASPMSLSELDRHFERIGDDPRPKGIILNLRGVAMPLAHLQTLRNSMMRLRAKGKRIICYTQGYSNALYYIASAADEIVLQPGGELETIGLRSETTFLKNALETIGLRMDSVAISPYKGAFDMFTRSDMSPEGKEQLDWLLDSQFDMLVQGMAEGRKTTSEAIRAMIDNAPYLDDAALASGYVDAVESEEALHRRLNTEYIIPWKTAEKKLLRKWRKSTDKYIAVLNVSGLMVPGESGKPPVDIPIPIPFIGGERSGDVTVVQQVRRLMKDESAAAVILYINSGGGAAIAAEAMTSALAELAKDRPLVAFMDTVAASGGYYVATPAQWIIAQPGTITGSIGVISGKLITGGLFEKVRVNRVELTRGANAGLMSDAEPYTAEQRTRVLQSIQHIYKQFVGHVSASRKMTSEAVDAVGGGRVWTGVQAKNNGLVDELGDWRTALAKARELAHLPEETPVILVSSKGKPLPAQLAKEANPAAILDYLHGNVHAIANGLPQMLMPMDWNVK